MLNTNLQNSKRHGVAADCNKKYEVFLKEHGWGGKRFSRWVTSRTWPKSIPHCLLSRSCSERVGNPSEKGGPSKLEVNFMPSVNVFSVSSKREGWWRKKNIVTVLGEISMPSSSSASEGGHGSSNNFEESEEEGEVAGTVGSDGGQEESEIPYLRLRSHQELWSRS